MNVPHGTERLVREIDGWLDLGRAEKALQRLDALRRHPGTRPLALTFEVRALILLERFEEALDLIGELRTFEIEAEWLEVTEAWCQKRIGKIDRSIACMRRLIDEHPRSAIGHYNLGCYLALTGATEEALDEISLAVGIDPQFREHLVDEKDLDTLRNDKRLEALLPPDLQS